MASNPFIRGILEPGGMEGEIFLVPTGTSVPFVVVASAPVGKYEMEETREFLGGLGLPVE